MTAWPIPPAAPVTITPLPSSPAPTLQAMASPVLDLRQNSFAPKRVDDILDDVDAKPRLHGWVHVSVDVLERLGHQLVLHRVAERLELEHLTGPRAKADRETRRRGDRRRPRVSVRLTSVVLDTVGDLLEAGDSLGPSGIDADDIHGAGLQNPLVAIQIPLSLTVGDEGGGLAS